jgi:hypothetical protein
MMEVKHSNVLRLTPNVKQAFILYNSARLETLIATFHEKGYPPLPSLHEVNLDLLTEEGWELVKCMLSLPDHSATIIAKRKFWSRIDCILFHQFMQESIS